jgi:hypothetical protein
MTTERKIGSMMDAQPSLVDLSAKNRFFAKQGNGGFDLCGDGQPVAGVIIEGKAVGQHTSIATGGQVKVVAGAAIAAGAKVASNAAGKAVTATAGENVAGIAQHAVAADGQLVTIEIDRSILQTA